MEKKKIFATCVITAIKKRKLDLFSKRRKMSSRIVKKGQKTVSLVGAAAGEDGGAGGGGTVGPVRTGEILILFGLLVGELGDFGCPLPLTC